MAAPDSASAANNQERPSRGTKVSKIVYEITKDNSFRSVEYDSSIYHIVAISQHDRRSDVKVG